MERRGIQDGMPGLSAAGQADGDLSRSGGTGLSLTGFKKKSCSTGTWPDPSISEDQQLAPESSQRYEVVWGGS